MKYQKLTVTEICGIGRHGARELTKTSGAGTRHVYTHEATVSKKAARRNI